MEIVKRLFSNTEVINNQHGMAGRGTQSPITVLAICLALALPGIAMAKKPVKDPNPVDSSSGCVVLPPVYVDTGHTFPVKVVRAPSYTGVWSQPTVDVKAVFTKTDGGEVTKTSSETISRYGVTYVNVTMLAPSCNGSPCEIDNTVDAVVTAVVKEPINKGKRVRESICKPATASVNPAN